MRKLLGGSFFLAAGVYLSVVKPLDLITIMAIIFCVVLAGFSTTKNSKWSIIGGALMVAISLFLQSILSYNCMDCMKADILIMSGMVTLSVLERGSKKLALRVITSVIAVFMTVTIIIYTDVSGEANLGRKLRVNEMGRYVEASNLDKSTMLLDTAEKPVLFFSLTCGTCIKAVDTLIKEDPEGSRWTPV